MMQMGNTPPPGKPAMSPGGQKVSEQQITQLLNEIAKVAADNGIDFRAIVMKFVRGAAGGPPTPPAAAMPPAGAGPTGGPSAPSALG